MGGACKCISSGGVVAASMSRVETPSLFQRRTNTCAPEILRHLKLITKISLAAENQWLAPKHMVGNTII